jgi:hypothetical protein
LTRSGSSSARAGSAPRRANLFADPGECRRALTEAGFDVDSFGFETVTVLWRVPTAELLFEAELHAGVRNSAVLRAQPPERLQAIRAAMAEGVRRYADGEAFTLPIVARVVSAAAPARRRARRGRSSP